MNVKMKKNQLSVSAEPRGIVVVDNTGGSDVSTTVSQYNAPHIRARAASDMRERLTRMAIGVLIVLVGRAVKVSEHIVSGKKISRRRRAGVGQTDLQKI